jgi:hypothetical protein
MLDIADSGTIDERPGDYDIRLDNNYGSLAVIDLPSEIAAHDDRLDVMSRTPRVAG